MHIEPDLSAPFDPAVCYAIGRTLSMAPQMRVRIEWTIQTSSNDARQDMDVPADDDRELDSAVSASTRNRCRTSTGEVNIHVVPEYPSKVASLSCGRTG